MVKLKIIERDNYQYLLEDKDGKRYSFNMEFYDTSKIPNKDDYLYMADNLLDKNYEEYSDSYSFGAFGSNYGRNIFDEDNPDIVVLEISGKKIYLQRHFG